MYQHFAGKDELLAAVVVEGFVALVESLKRAAKGEKPSLSAIASAHVRFGLERPRRYEVMFVAPAVAESGREPTQVGTVTRVVWAALHGLVMFSITKRVRPGRA